MNAARKRPGFTLVELLVVVGIIAILAALLTPVVMQSLAKARNAAIKAEIDMLHMAIMNYKNEYGSFPPCIDSNGTASNLVNRHLLRLFPRISSSGTATAFQVAQIRPESSIYPWLCGYTDDPTDPLANVNASLTRNKLFDFDSSRVLSKLYYYPSGKQGSPFIYINSANYVIPGAGTVATYTYGDNTYYAHRVPLPAAPTVFNNGSQPAFNPDTFQILCAGRDEQFGTDDDLSNFWPGTRREYLDSLKD